MPNTKPLKKTNPTSNKSFLIKLFVGKINSVKFWPKSGEIQFPVPVKLEPEQVFEIPVPE